MDSGATTTDANMQIFKYIATMITETEFNEAIATFFEQNNGKFDENEENKHEYMAIYDEYVNITEKVIESKLMENHGIDNDSIKAFVENFKDNKAAYEEENSEAVQALFGMIDFDNFKQQMLSAKKGFVDVDDHSEQSQERKDYQNAMAENEWVNFQKVFAEDLNSKEIGWKLKVNQQAFKNGYKCQVYQRKQPGQKIDVIRITSEFQNCKVAEISDYYLNPPNTKLIKEATTIETYPDGSFAKYWRFKMPMMTDRDNVLHISQIEKDGGIFFSMKTIEHPAKPVVKGVIRMFTYVALFLKQEGDNVTMMDCEHFDMKGYMPASLLNMTYASEAAKEFTSMMKHIYAKQKQ